MSNRSDIDVTALAAALEARRTELRRLSDVAEQERRPVELDQTRQGRLSRMDALQVQAMAEESERRRAIELMRIEAALDRIQSGDYGYCLSCDDEIPVARLQFDPAVATCVDCARDGER